ncbi:lactonase family protein [Leifsonia sp. NPDC058230]|uniref:lactonase family protein n=1 Tax=Leifsonia sp. NPDC058230 TaxID=3346391 RepID=UPI0036DB2142
MTRALLIGTYTQKVPDVDGHGDGIVSAVFDGEMVADAVLAAPLANPSWLTANADGSRVYSVLETAPDGWVAAFARDGSGALSPLGTVSAGGAEPAHLTLDPSERFLVVGTYSGGSISVIALDDDGALGERVAFVQHRGSGPDARRQEGPHVHQLSFDPITGDLVVVDLGLGQVLFYGFGSNGQLTLRPEATISLGAAGPRHLAFHPDGQHAFVVNELGNTVDVLRRSGDRFERVGGASTRPADATGDSTTAAVRVSPSGATVFVTNRGDDTVAVFSFDAADGLTLVATEPTRGKAPRDLIVTPDGDRVLVANQDTDSVAVFSFDEETRSFEFLSLAPVPTPVCLRLV